MKQDQIKTERKPYAIGFAPKHHEVFQIQKLPVTLETLKKHGGTLRDYMDELEDNLILEAIIKAKGNNTQASAMLGINRTTMVMKFFRLREYGIDVGAYRDPKDKSEE